MTKYITYFQYSLRAKNEWTYAWNTRECICQNNLGASGRVVELPVRLPSGSKCPPSVTCCQHDARDLKCVSRGSTIGVSIQHLAARMNTWK